MKRSTHGILTTHAGGLALPQDLWDMHKAHEKGQPLDREKYAVRIRQAVTDVVKQQVDNGISVPNDGEMSKSSWQAYVKDRISGFAPDSGPRNVQASAEEFPEYFAKRRTQVQDRYAAVGPLVWRDFGAVQTDIDNMKSALRNVKAEDSFMTAVAPGQIANTHGNKYFPTREAFMHALAGLMKQEYEAIAKSGIVLQVDAPDLAIMRHNRFKDTPLGEYQKIIGENVDAINAAIRDIPKENVRLHVCWGRPEGPKNRDVPLRDIVDNLLKSKVGALSIVGANARHEWEWKVWKEVKIPEGLILIPGVTDNTTNIIEHPETIAERLVKYASVVGRENVIAGVDCGFGNQPEGNDVDPRIAWAKLKALGDGAALASKELWKR